MQNQTTITCPNCKTQIDVNEIQYHELEERLKREHQLELESKRKEYKVHLDKLDAREQAMKEQEEKFTEQLQKATREQVRLEKQKLQMELRKELEAEQGESMAALEKELSLKSEQVKELNNSKIEIEKLKREKDEVASAAKVEAQKALSEELKVEKEKLVKLAQEAKVQAQKELEEANELKMKAKDEQLEQIKRELDNARRKAEQGSMQIQGEALELAIESWLSSQFPFDSIEEVKKGAFGADCVQHVHTREIQNCGVICYESKNTKTWSEGWITKLKQDMLKVNADLGVLVTSVYPKEMSRMGFVDGIWVCSLDEFKGSASLLRESLIRLQQVSMKEENKADKMTLLYNYMTGNEFSMQMKAIVDGFTSMQTELDKERRSLMATWKRRQKTIDGVLANTTEMYGALQGIAGSAAIVHIDALELPDGMDEE
ncbi:MAG: Caldesmon [uncultured Sulfurovum sp.]|uniref:Caldesmon n=1 Tax=uncultured Sulfurovum sp. TaxID=269237 RepID=A0A6S6SYT4_9BACT|nr:MAG: Caldesmon [uncultured Sulfurovum sp.]